MVKTIIFFQPTINGHYLEYMHHEYMESVAHEEIKIIFIVPSSFKQKKNMLKWPPANHIEFSYLTDDEENKCKVTSKFKQAINQTLISRKYINKYNADGIFFNSLVNLMPVLPFFIPRGCKVSGIIYNNYLWNTTEGSIKKFVNYTLYKLFAIHRSFHSIFLLNDEKSVEVLNARHKVRRFKYLPDPIQDIDMLKIINVREKLGIKQSDTVFLQLGIQNRKHALDILSAIDMASDESLNNKAFIFTGVFANGIEEEYKMRIKKLRSKAKIIDLSGRIPFDELYNLFSISDFCFALYDNTSMSSGVVGYSSFFGSNIIGPSQGLLGHLIKEYRLGICIDEITPQSILSTFTQSKIEVDREYCKTHRVEDFNYCIFSEILY